MQTSAAFVALESRPTPLVLILVATVLACAGCIRAGFAPGSAQGGGNGDTIDTRPRDQATDRPTGDAPGGLATDLAVDGTPSALGTFGPARRIVELSTAADEDDPTLTADLLTIVYESEQTRSLELWISTRATPTAAWNAPTHLAQLDSANNETNPVISSDGLTLWFASDRDAPGDLDIMVTRRASPGTPWSAPEAVTELNSVDAELPGYVDANQTTIYMSSRRAGTEDLYFATRQNRSDTWSAPTPLSNLNTGVVREASPHVAGAGLYLFFESGSNAATLSKIFVSDRAATDEPFDNIVELNELNAGPISGDPWVAEDLSYVVFQSNRTGNLELYEAFRQ